MIQKLAWLSLALIGLIAVLPLDQPFHRLPLTSFYSEWLALALGTGAGITLLVRDFWQHLSIPKFSLYLLGLVALIAGQSLAVQHAYPSQALLPALYLSWAMLLATVAVWLRTQLGTKYVVGAFAWFLLIGGILHALIGLAQYLDYPGYLAALVDYNTGGAFSGNLGQRNHYATQITLAVVALTYLFAHGRLSRYSTVPLALLLVFVLTLSASRAVMLYLAAILVLSALGYRKERDHIHRRFATMSAFLLVLFLLAQYLLPPFSEWLRQIMAESGFDSGKSNLLTAMVRLRGADGIDLRLSEWHKAWVMFLQSPVWGVGIGHYGWYSFNLQALPAFAGIPKPELFNHSHNLFTQVLAEMGAVGLLLLCALLFGWLKQHLADWWTPTSWFIGACLTVLFLHSNHEYPLWYSYFLGMAAFLLGLGEKRLVKTTFTPRLGQTASAITLAFSAAILAITFVGYQTIANINSLIFRSSPESAARAIQAVSRNILLAPWAEQVMATHGITDKKIIAGQLALTTRVMTHHPNPIKVERQIRYLALAGRTNDAISLLTIAAAAYPTHLPAYICAWQAMPDSEMEDVVDRARKLTKVPASCETVSPERDAGASMDRQKPLN